MADVVLIAPEQYVALIAEAERHYPLECVGVLLGYGDYVVTSEPLANIAPTKDYFFTVDRTEFERCVRLARQKRLNIIGFYHSHPDHPPIPSEQDVIGVLPYGTQMIQIIVSINRHEARTTAWRYRALSDVIALEIIHERDSVPLPWLNTRAQQVGLLIGTGLAVAILIFIALSLLPPAPPIP